VDFGHYFVNGLLPALVLALPLSALALTAGHLVPAGLRSTVQELPQSARLILAFAIGEVGFYWGHRWSHEWPWLWRFHAVHHSAEHMDFLVNSRAHPFDMVFTRLVGLSPLYILGFADPSLQGSATPVAVVLVGTVWGFFIHANLRWRFGPLEWLVSTPAFHHWHHSRVDHVNHNYSSTLPFLDRLFSTHHLPDRWPEAYGVQTPMPDTLLGQWLSPWRSRL
jgi:sterol desaturase/sphingolipid hydroxylase (fatty acid hydroxylase superfamily)